MTGTRLYRPTLHVLVGVPGSGKTTWLRNRGVVDPISSDHLRFLLTGDESNQSVNGEVFEVLYSIVRSRLSRGLSTYVDATNTTRRGRERLLEVGMWFAQRARTRAVVMDTPLETCVKWNEQRAAAGGRRVPLHVIERMHRQLREEYPCVEEGFDRVDVVLPFTL